jgi:hypothetical protein
MISLFVSGWQRGFAHGVVRTATPQWPVALLNVWVKAYKPYHKKAGRKPGLPLYQLAFKLRSASLA